MSTMLCFASLPPTSFLKNYALPISETLTKDGLKYAVAPIRNRGLPTMTRRSGKPDVGTALRFYDPDSPARTEAVRAVISEPAAGERAHGSSPLRAQRPPGAPSAMAARWLRKEQSKRCAPGKLRSEWHGIKPRKWEGGGERGGFSKP